MNYPRIIGLNGVARSGKDTLATILRDLYGYQPVSFSDILNKVLYTLDREVGVGEAGLFVKAEDEGARFLRYADLVDKIGYEDAKEFPGVRRLLQVMGTEVGRNLLGEDVWVRALFNNLPSGLVAITNVRFPNEYDATHGAGGVVWRVERPGYAASNGHISDTALDAYTFEHVITNDGTVEELAHKVIALMDPVKV